MTELQTPYGILYIEELEYNHNCPAMREEEDRIKVFDSLGRYLTYFTVGWLAEVADIDNISIEDKYQEFINAYINPSKETNLHNDLGRYLTYVIGEDWEHYGSLQSLKEYFKEAGIFDWVTEDTTQEQLLENEYICQIGDTLILLSEY